ncbi:MAG: hypothetical protein UV74_C0013G0430 [Candidatus Woesebacteria bacterium GW2011_GWB1_43_14]|uniref:Uncharacterized protein n=1 Tax=Candidatus Woesebacteria bacterium GW2011_GWB1_43_14 TaxID=1618578 RepID=A0A0G1GEL5_9BACT|nr:MAG: hypothetical protein UT21_C0001G0142 [Candidatus Woesebacteria bacterium GW2011_GWA1_39_11b]KKS77513.1 MAG: hypothetical protein UV51_C0006G0030 [Candidatus Woesebacteria bacterium GW2011_GWC1_42_9]KKS97308.1 MAG: hypothetical protein UV74_C0013G0430 [Candidatus Woesebacteria bacterium GW2011_GWB1_43_14]
MEEVQNVPVPPVPQTQGVDGNKNMLKKKAIPFIAGVLVILFGVGTGYALARGGFGGGSGTAIPGAKETETEAGVDDESLFPDLAEGMLKEGGFDGDGTHHLDRGMGEEKNVYLTSTVINLQSFVGKEVQVWGESIASQKAPWLMDVGKIKIKK